MQRVFEQLRGLGATAHSNGGWTLGDGTYFGWHTSRKYDDTLDLKFPGMEETKKFHLDDEC
ncbi:hypothetical protein GCM10010921_01050 [Microbacterium album]|uniref:Uncharacterized protein n=1 Tax=Microbacterium album TaxID=2053191 RepID=A0A917IAX0_9MICO|nr:hypothetical protein GCM10010921_01050 [Microbacterium album]